MAKKTRTQVRPLIARPGAQYTCFGDGLCCTDIHGLGPLTKKELVQVRKRDSRGAGWDEDFEERMLRTAPDGGCHFLLPDLRCRIHAETGPEAKPDGCRRFPLGLVATPEGGRVTTHHRCPCRTMGARPDLDPEAALPSLVNRAGRPKADARVDKIRLERKAKRVPFEEWRAIEGRMLDALAAGTEPERVLDADPFPRLKGSSWEDQADEFVAATDGTSFGVAIATFGEMVRSLLDPEHRYRGPGRPWASAYDRAEAREGEDRPEDEVFADWIADEIWSLGFAEDSSFDVCRAELATRLAVARAVARHYRETWGIAPGRSAAEALTVVELVGDSEFWSELVERIRL
ncbi:MAG: hypothetical protein CMN30_05590 [Sandaracinus sp.]|nr:hypothetical protein [Sandaracinus sp.]